MFQRTLPYVAHTHAMGPSHMIPCPALPVQDQIKAPAVAGQGESAAEGADTVMGDAAVAATAIEDDDNAPQPVLSQPEELEAQAADAEAEAAAALLAVKVRSCFCAKSPT